ncbi:hypothetical protein ACRN98_22015 [Shewanella oncorhynchi]|uniref:hypothetical protein n=1 Tax=Shewanella TaxID=22 RepID=UPI0021D95618|nr:hypothetical protein [Shewanella sp. SM69]MCU8036939.1 hypothetical protein [Shewanella sp. SM69]
MAEPTKLTQAQALFAVLAGAAQARRERVYYRDGVLRSTLYSPIPVDADTAYNNVSIAIEIMYITPVLLDINDEANSSVTLDIIKTLATKPEGTDEATNSVSLAIVVSKVIRDTSAVDVATNTVAISTIKYDVVRGFVEDAASNSVTLGVIKL